MFLKQCRVDRRRTLKLGSLTLAGAIVAVGLAGCGSSSPSSDTKASGGMTSLTVAVPSTNTAWADLYIAEAGGYFKSEGLNVKVLSGPVTSTVAYLQSGQADLVEWSASPAISAADKGLNTKVIEANNADGGLALIGSPKIASIAQAKAKPNCRLGSPPKGTVAYSYALNFVKTLGLSNCTIAEVASVASLSAATLSGQYDLQVGVYTDALKIESGGGHILEDPSTPQFAKTFQGGGHFPNVVTFGVADHMAAIKPAIEKFLRAEVKAHEALATQSDGVDKLVSNLQSVDELKTEKASTLKTDLNFGKPFYAVKFGGPTGYIDEASWKLVLNSLKDYGISGYDPSASVNSYAQRVDMSYLKDATSGK